MFENQNVFADLLPALPAQAEESVFRISNVEYCLAENGKEHHTSRYDIMNRRVYGTDHLVVRRGQPFIINVRASRYYNSNRDDICIVFTPEDTEMSRRTYPVITEVVQRNEVSSGAWRAEIQQAYSNNVLRIAVTPAANAPIGKWYMMIMTRTRNLDGCQTFQADRPFYLLFNAWCKDDPVYLDDESERGEYVLNDTGLVWLGNAKVNFPAAWSYSQFSSCILECAIFLISTIAELGSLERGDPVRVTRALCEIMNFTDDGDGTEVMEGRWAFDYSYGTEPTMWMGSEAILQQYYMYGRPVKYGQCRSIAGVLATLLRALGLPCRVVTNFESPEDDNRSLTIDKVIDENNELVYGYTDEHMKTWNYHVWNEVWMKRSDLAPDFHGWQVLDGTYKYGPASVAAIKIGDLKLPYDMQPIYAAVNADMVWWRLNSWTGYGECIGCDASRIGQKISTKAVGTLEREDITHNYKYPEGSKKEREINEKVLSVSAASGSPWAQMYLNEQQKIDDLIFNLELTEDLMIGQPFSVTLTINNVGQMEMYRVSVNLCIDIVMYTGQEFARVKQSDRIPKIIYPNSSVQEQLYIHWAEYYPLLFDQCSFKLSCYATVYDVDFTYIHEETFSLQKLHVKIEVNNEPVVANAVQVTARFKNPLPIPLTGGMFCIGGVEQMVIPLLGDVEVGGEVICPFQVTPLFEGKQMIIIKFYSQELKDVDGFHEFIVKGCKG
ncbi:annulin-like [Planococcus citri]|uniref:annulin-like n=1 Tax=Planococcus citri TaxID=170843 RepID=UPI0031F7DA7A